MKKKITSDDYGVIVLGMNALIKELEQKNEHHNFDALLESALEIGQYLQAKIDKREALGVGWYN